MNDFAFPARAAALNAENSAEIEAIPAYSAILTAKGEAFAIPTPLQSRMAILLLSDMGLRCLALVEPQSISGHEYANLIATVEHAGYKVASEKVVSIMTLRSLYEGSRDLDHPKDKHQLSGAGSQSDAERMLLEIVDDAIAKRASDIHIWLWSKEGEETGRVEFRIDGHARLQQKYCGGIERYRDLDESMKVAFGSLSERGSTSDPAFLYNKDQYSSINITVGKHQLQIRYQSFSLYYGNSYAIRVPLVDDAKPRTFAQLGYAKSHEDAINLGVRRRRGLILTCGTTGSGKSTTNFNMVMSMPDKDSKIIYEIADPVERVIPGVRQKQVQRSTAQAGKNESKYAGPIRDLLRGDPDVIVVGEMRDPDTGNAIETAVLTGHQIFTTTHVGSAFEAIIRITSKDIGMSYNVVGGKGFLNVIIYQHLLALLCPQCSIDSEKAKNLGLLTPKMAHQLTKKFKLNLENIRFHNEDGCPDCNHVGTIGRTVVAEVVLMNDVLRRLIREGKVGEAEELWRASRKTDFDDPDCTGKTALEHALYKVNEGIIDPRQVEAEFDPFELYEVIPIGGSGK